MSFFTKSLFGGGLETALEMGSIAGPEVLLPEIALLGMFIGIKKIHQHRQEKKQEQSRSREQDLQNQRDQQAAQIKLEEEQKQKEEEQYQAQLAEQQRIAEEKKQAEEEQIRIQQQQQQAEEQKRQQQISLERYQSMQRRQQAVSSIEDQNIRERDDRIAQMEDQRGINYSSRRNRQWMSAVGMQNVNNFDQMDLGPNVNDIYVPGQGWMNPRDPNYQNQQNQQVNNGFPNPGNDPDNDPFVQIDDFQDPNNINYNYRYDPFADMIKELTRQIAQQAFTDKQQKQENDYGDELMPGENGGGIQQKTDQTNDETQTRPGQDGHGIYNPDLSKQTDAEKNEQLSILEALSQNELTQEESFVQLEKIEQTFKEKIPDQVRIQPSTVYSSLATKF